jgi:hypothetical protein
VALRARNFASTTDFGDTLQLVSHLEKLKV